MFVFFNVSLSVRINVSFNISIDALLYVYSLKEISLSLSSFTYWFSVVVWWSRVFDDVKRRLTNSFRQAISHWLYQFPKWHSVPFNYVSLLFSVPWTVWSSWWRTKYIVLRFLSYIIRWCLFWKKKIKIKKLTFSIVSSPSFCLRPVFTMRNGTGIYNSYYVYFYINCQQETSYRKTDVAVCSVWKF